MTAACLAINLSPCDKTSKWLFPSSDSAKVLKDLCKPRTLGSVQEKSSPQAGRGEAIHRRDLMQGEMKVNT